MSRLRQLSQQLVPRRNFPDPHRQDLEDVVAMGDVLNSKILLESYSYGIFPWPHEGLPMLWCCPVQRGILNFCDLNIPKSFHKFLKKTAWQIRFNSDFAQVISECAKAKRPGQSGTWIHGALENAFTQFHKDGYAHSIEVWEGENMVGGLYGVFVAGAFSGESMFYKKTNASKLALYATIRHLQEVGLQWMDIQMLTPITEQFGGRYISKSQFLQKLELAQKAYFESRASGSANQTLFPQGAPFSAV